MLSFVPRYTFAEYIKNRKIFISIAATDEYSTYLEKFARENGLYNGLDHSGNPTNDLKYHVTLWYSSTGWLDYNQSQMPEIEIPVENWELLGKRKEHLTLKLIDNGWLEGLKDHFGQYGLTSEWPTFKPHMTLVYNYNKRRIPNIKPPKTVRLGQVYAEETVTTD